MTRISASKSIICASALTGACALFLLTGCAAGNHQIIEANQECISCHSEVPTTYDNATATDAVTSAGMVTVSTNAATVEVCKPIFTDEKGSSFVPQSQRSVKVEGGSVDISLEPGTWALCVADGSNSKGTLVVVSSDGAQSASIEL